MMKDYSKFGVLIIIIFATVLAFFNFQKKEYDWDMPGYLGSLFATENTNPKSIHEKTYHALQKESSKVEFQNIIGKNGNHKARKLFSENAEAFNQQLPYYQIKVGYNELVYLLYNAGFSAALSTLIPNFITYVLMGAVLFLIFNTIFRGKVWLSVFAAALMLLIPDLQYLSKVASPDLLAVFFLLIFMLSVLRKEGYFVQFLWLLNLILARPDYIIFALGYFVLRGLYDVFCLKKKNFQLLGYTLVSLLVYLFILQFYHYPGWKHVFYDTFIERRFFVINNEPNFSMHEYASIMISALVNFKKLSIFAILLLAGSLYFAKNLWDKLFTIFLFGSIYLKFLFFPAAGETRFFIGFLLLQLIWMMVLISTSKEQKVLKG